MLMLTGGGVRFSKMLTQLFVTEVVAISGLPSPSKSATTRLWLAPSRDERFERFVMAVANVPSPNPGRITRGLPATISKLPSPLKSATASADGEIGTAIVFAAPRVPSPLFNRIDIWRLKEF